MSEKDRAFKGIWIPKEIYLADDLSWSEKILLIEVDSLDNDKEKGCFASNKYFADFLGMKETSVANMVSRLKQKGYLKQVFFDGRNRGLRTSFTDLTARKFKTEPSQKSESSLHKKVSQPSQKSETEPSQKSEHNNTVLGINNTERGEHAPERVETTEEKTESDNQRTEPPYPPLNSQTESSPPAFGAPPLPRAVEIYIEEFPTTALDGERLKMFCDELPFVDEKVWRTTLKNWKLDGHKSGNISGMIDKYGKQLERQNIPSGQTKQGEGYVF